MYLRRRSVLLRVTLLVLVPLAFLAGIFGYAITSSISSALALDRARAMINDLRQPVASLQHALTHERAEMIVYDTRPMPGAYAALQRQEAVTDHAVASFLAAAASPAVRHSTAAGAAKAIVGLRAGLTGLTGLRAKITEQSIGAQQAFAVYNGLIAASYQILEQSIIQVGNAKQVLPAIAVIELAISNEYLQQESALLNGNFAARSFPPRDHQAFVGLVGAHRLLYAQSYSYLTPVDRAHLKRDVNPQAAHTVARLEDMLVASPAAQRAAPGVSAATWNAAVATVSRQTREAFQQAEARLIRTVSMQATAKLRAMYLEGGVGLAAVVISLILSLSIAVRLARQLHGLRDSALEMANVALPGLVRRLRAGEDVDAAELVPPLEPGIDEIGQVRSAFNTAQRTAVESAVDEARVRRGINDLFRNLARRSQSLLERQMGLLDTLERTAAEPEDLDGLFLIDHLTTRMRRHAENLLVLAGDSLKRAFRGAVPFVDVLRAAATEVEDYKRIKVIARTSAALAGPAVADVIHLLAELVENATIFSPPHTEVRITGGLVASGYAVDIEDRGPGMTTEELATFNATLADPPLFDMSGSDRLGLFVAASLARRHAIAVTLRDSPYGGITAIVLIPQALVVPAGAIGEVAPASGQPNGLKAPAGKHAVMTLLGTSAGYSREPFDPLPPTKSAGQPGLAESAGPAVPGPAVPGPAVPWPAGSADLAPPADADPLGAPVGLTENGMPRRVRQSSLAPQLREAATPSRDEFAMTSSRSPAEAGSAMSDFRRGWQQGIGGPGMTTELLAHQDTVLPRDGENR